MSLITSTIGQGLLWGILALGLYLSFRILNFPDMTVEEAASKFGTKQAAFRLWIEKAEKRDDEGAPFFGDRAVDLRGQQNNRSMMLFLKHFDTKTQSLFGVGNFYAAFQDRVQDVGPQILEVNGLI